MGFILKEKKLVSPCPFSYWQYRYAWNKYLQCNLKMKPFGGSLWQDLAIWHFKRHFKFGLLWESLFFYKNLFKSNTFPSAYWVYSVRFLFSESLCLEAVSWMLLFFLMVNGIMNQLPNTVHGNLYIYHQNIFFSGKR